MFRRGQVLKADQLNEIDGRTRQGLNLPLGSGLRGLLSEAGQSLFGQHKPPIRLAKTVDTADYPTQDAEPGSDLADVGEDCIGNYPIELVDIDYDDSAAGASCRTVTPRGVRLIAQNIFGDWVPPGIIVPVFEHRGRLFLSYQAGLAAFCCDSTNESDSQSDSESESDSQSDPSDSNPSDSDPSGSDSNPSDSDTDGSGSGSDSGTGTGTGSDTDGTDGSGSDSGTGTGTGTGSDSDGTDGSGSGTGTGTGTDGSGSDTFSDSDGTEGSGTGSGTGTATGSGSGSGGTGGTGSGSGCLGIGYDWEDIPISDAPAFILGYDDSGCLVRVRVGSCDDSGSGS